MLTPSQTLNTSIPTTLTTTTTLGFNTDRPLKNVPRKRRKLGATSPARVVALESGYALAPETVLGMGRPACISCHRALGVVYANTANMDEMALDVVRVPSKMDGVICAVCHAPTCLICSRRCTASPTAASHPQQQPPPHQHQHLHSQLPRGRPLTALNMTNTTSTTPNHSIPSPSPSPWTPASTPRRRKHASPSPSSSDELTDRSAIGTAGCGRTLCRTCCPENERIGTSTCVECGGRAKSMPIS